MHQGDRVLAHHRHLGEPDEHVRHLGDGIFAQHRLPSGAEGIDSGAYAILGIGYEVSTGTEGNKCSTYGI